MTQKGNISLKELFFVFLKINAVTFGGGYTILPIIRNEFITKRQLIDEEEMMNIITVAQSGPGGFVVSASVLTSYRLLGLKGAFVSLLASVIPPLVIITLVYYAYEAFRDNIWVNAALQGMSGVISAVLFMTVYSMAGNILKKNTAFSLCLMVGAFVASWFLELHIVLILVILAVIGLVYFTFVKENGEVR